MDPETFRTCKPADLLAKNPNGKVPTLVHGEVVMWDSCAIMLYLLDLFDTEHKLAPKDPVFRARFYKLMFYCSGTVDNLTATSSPLQITLDDPMPGQKAEIIAQNKKAYRELVGPLLRSELGDGPYMAGSKFTALDIVFGYNMECVFYKREWYADELPSLKEYYLRLKKERPLYQKGFQPIEKRFLR